ncbi:MAG TPA: HAD-IA family hydrolase [Thermoleophilaceae bacterium]|nr:HAD-IA family hydrolase [Thermoleophilaceae bacterium]
MATFDCYGTLVDWEGGLGSFLYDLVRRHGERDPGPGRALRERWEELQFERLQGDYQSYGEILVDSLSEWAGERGQRWNDEDGEALVSAMGSWQPFGDTVPALRRAREAGLRLWIVSNTDRAIMRHTLRQLEIDFDGVTVAEDARAYKPSTEPFEHALAAIGEPPEHVLHVAFGFKYDISAAQSLGMSTAWVNRKGEPAPGAERPDHEWRNLWPLAELARPAA